MLRKYAGVTQQALAVAAGTSQPTIALYERGAKSPTLETLQRLASSLGLELVLTFTPQMSREDQRSLIYHQAICNRLRKDPVSSLERARSVLMKVSHQHKGAKKLFDSWSRWLELPLEELILKILDPGQEAREMRQVSPFAGLLSPKERVILLTQFRKEYPL